MKRKALLIAGTLLLSASVLTACGNKDKGTDAETTETTTEAENTDTTESTSEAASETETTTEAEAPMETTKETSTEAATAESSAAAEGSAETESYGEGWEYDKETDSWHMYSVPDSVWEEVRQKTGMSEEEFYKEQEKYADLKDSKPYSWDKSEAPLTDEQIKEIEAEQASILAEKEAAEQAAQTTTESE